jgi:hypothetical protein
MKTINSYKGFNKDMKCRDFQFEEGKEYTHDGKAKACESGFHACEYPLDVFGYYPPAESVFHAVEQSGEIATHSDDSKIASTKIKIGGRLSISDMAKASVEFTLSRVKKTKKKSATNTGDYSAATNTGYRSAATNTGDYSAATNTGYQSAATNTGYQSAATNTGDYSAATNTGNQSAATNTGNQSAATNTGYRSAATNTGYRSAATNTGNQSAATNTGNQSAATNTGDYSAATNTGYRSAATNTGNQSAATIEGSAKESIAAGFGYQNKAKASEGNWIVLAYRDEDCVIKHIKSAKAGVDIKPDVWYMLDDSGKFIEC